MRPEERPEVPLWRQAAEGIGLVAILSFMIGLMGLAMSLVVALLF